MAKFGFGKFLSATAKAADKAIKQAARERERQAKKAEADRKKAQKEHEKSLKKAASDLSKSNKQKLTDNVNRNYRNSDITRYNELDFVVGYEIKRSNNCDKGCSLCKAGSGKYPKNFNWTGWHDDCKCHIISVLTTDAEMDRMTDYILAGKDTSTFKSRRTVYDIPASLKSYFNENKESILYEMPDWYMQNKQYFN